MAVASASRAAATALRNFSTDGASVASSPVDPVGRASPGSKREAFEAEQVPSSTRSTVNPATLGSSTDRSATPTPRHPSDNPGRCRLIVHKCIATHEHCAYPLPAGVYTVSRPAGPAAAEPSNPKMLGSQRNTDGSETPLSPNFWPSDRVAVKTRGETANAAWLSVRRSRIASSALILRFSPGTSERCVGPRGCSPWSEY